MARFARLLPILGLAALSTARKCQNLTVEVDISARNGVFDLKAPETNIDVTNYIFELAKQGQNYTDVLLKGYATVKGRYELAATYCEPDQGPSKVLQILTHGVGFDRSYWDLSANNYNYSYTKVAVDDYGYSTFSWDRLGIAESSRGEPVNEIQSWLELAALRELTHKLRKSKVPGLKTKSFDKLVHVGHSFGSILSYTLTASEPCASDGIILTGFSHEGTYLPYFLHAGAWVQANTLAPLSDYADGYISAGLESASHMNFFAPGVFDPEMLRRGFLTAQPATVGELLTVGAGSGTPSEFEGPALVITGDRDIPFCGGDCSNTGDSELESMLHLSAEFLTEANPFEAFVVPDAGHGLAMEYTHVVTTGKILDFLAQNGLAAM